jgi:hypothetical protein
MVEALMLEALMLEAPPHFEPVVVSLLSPGLLTRTGFTALPRCR